MAHIQTVRKGKTCHSLLILELLQKIPMDHKKGKQKSFIIKDDVLFLSEMTNFWKTQFCRQAMGIPGRLWKSHNPGLAVCP